jgi:2,4-dienoyl-CoA reductase-like NADH-dependent reductase (Old Yellow Enzyme family)
MTTTRPAPAVGASTFQHLFTPFRVGRVTLRNRIVSTPHATRSGKDGYVTERYVRYQREKARGGAGLAALQGRVPEMLLVGDAMAPRLLHDALLEGTRAARQL